MNPRRLNKKGNNMRVTTIPDTTSYASGSTSYYSSYYYYYYYYGSYYYGNSTVSTGGPHHYESPEYMCVKDVTLTSDEKTQVVSLFTAMDKSGDGQLSYSEASTN